jgi:hypothetical protein
MYLLPTSYAIVLHRLSETTIYGGFLSLAWLAVLDAGLD